MTRLAITENDSGDVTAPMTKKNPDWDEWVPASATRNYVLGDPLLDWLDRFGEAKGFVPSVVDERADFYEFIFKKGSQFERKVIEHLRHQLEDRSEKLRTITQDGDRVAVRRAEKALATWRAMAEGVAAIDQGVLWDPENQTYGLPDLLVRSDVLADLFPEAMSPAEAAVPAPDLDIGNRHYVVVDIKFTTLRLTAKGMLGNDGSSLAYKVQLHIYNRSLARLQGHLPPRMFLMGRGWRQTQRGKTVRVDNCMDRLGPIDYHESNLADLADEAAEWIRTMRRRGHDWQVLPEPTVDELRPNAKRDAGRWSSAVQALLDAGGDLTALYGVSVAVRRRANAEGLTDWHDERVTPESLGVTRASSAYRLRALLEVNRESGADVLPERVHSARKEWITPTPVEFYVDFETVGDLNDDFSRFPEKGGQSLIFMVGCGHIEDGEWHFECFIADDLTQASEADAIRRWFRHMERVTAQAGSDTPPKVIHWADHEVSSLRRAYENAAATNQDGGVDWTKIEWFDFLKRVARSEPVVVRGAHGFGLKAITNALHDLGLVETRWNASVTDGQGAMIGAWWCQEQVNKGYAERLGDCDLMNQVTEYNEVDCRAMMEIVRYLRENH